MTNPIYEKYLETEILNADPVKLVRMLYRGAIESVGAARRHLAARAIRERAAQISRVWEILHELARSLDHEQGGEISQRLAALYVYMQGRLLEANAQQADAPLAEVESLLSTLSEAWQDVKQAPPPPAAQTAYVPVSCSY
jgi:flagellar secretion chaperone FliS